MSSQTQLQLLLLDRGATREIYIYFASALEALQFYQDVEHMRRVTRQILELQERRRREAEHRSHVTNPAAGSSNMASAQQGTDATPGASHHDVFSPSSNPAETAHGLTPHLGALDGFLNDGSLSPHLSQLGSPRLDPFS